MSETSITGITGESFMIIGICPASIYLLGTPVNCKLAPGHVGNHKIVIEWTTDGTP